MVPLLVIVLTSPFAAIVNNPLAIREVASSLTSTAGDGFQVEPLIPDADPSLQRLMAEAGVRPEDPIVYFGDYLGNLLQPWVPAGQDKGERVIVSPHWLPAHQSLALRWIPKGRGAVYTSRWIERNPSSGWMIQRKTGINSNADFNAFVSGREAWLFDLLHQTHIPTSLYENVDWQITWWEYVGDQPEIVRPVPVFGFLGPLSPDITVNGQPLAGSLHPEVWAQFGAGWGLLDPGIGGRWMSPGSILWVYSPVPVSADVRLFTTPETERRQFVRLEAGWNMVTLEGEGTVVTMIDINTTWRG
jgi:hypothetical protein